MQIVFRKGKPMEMTYYDNNQYSVYLLTGFSRFSNGELDFVFYLAWNHSW